jgi:hypothetical protein
MEEFKRDLKWFGNEILNLYSSKPSFFSKKRIESGVSFILGQIFMIAYFMTHIDTMEVPGMVAFVGVEFAIAGWNIHQIQKEKRDLGVPDTTEEEIIEEPVNEVIDNQSPQPIGSTANNQPIDINEIITPIEPESQD